MTTDLSQYNTLNALVEDAVSVACEESFKLGKPMSGEQAWKYLMMHSIWKWGQFNNDD